jgi:hypothetical protein
LLFSLFFFFIFLLIFSIATNFYLHYFSIMPGSRQLSISRFLTPRRRRNSGSSSESNGRSQPRPRLALSSQQPDFIYISSSDEDNLDSVVSHRSITPTGMLLFYLFSLAWAYL